MAVMNVPLLSISAPVRKRPLVLPETCRPGQIERAMGEEMARAIRAVPVEIKRTLGP